METQSISDVGAWLIEKKLNKLVPIFEGMTFRFNLLLMSIGLLCIKLLHVVSLHLRLGTSAVSVVNYHISSCSNMHEVCSFTVKCINFQDTNLKRISS